MSQDLDIDGLRHVATAVAYRMVGSRTEAEDLAQEALVRVAAAAAHDELRSPEAFVTTVATRLSIDHLRLARVQREEYLGPWLPEPISADALVDGAAAAEVADSLSFALMSVLEALEPVERGAFLLREVFGYGYDEVAAVLDRSEPACRQLVARARARVQAGRPRRTVAPDEHRRVLDRFLAATRHGDVVGLVAVLAEDAVMVSDGGRATKAARRPVEGRDRIVRFLRSIGPRALGSRRVEVVEINGEPGFVALVDGEVALAGTIEVADGHVTAVRWVLNPDKLRWVHAPQAPIRPLRLGSPAMSFPGAFVESSPDKPAVIMAGSGEVLTYAELDERATRLANLLGSLGLTPGDHVAFCIENQIRFLEVAWGCHYAGLHYTAASTRLTPGELSYIIDDCGARVFIGSKALGDLARGTLADTPKVEARLMLDGVVDGFTSYEDALASASPDPAPDRVEGTDMLYSSGTTGQPKGVQIPLPNAPLGTKPALQMLAEGLLGYGEDMVYLNPAPLYHAAPLRFTMAVHRDGGTAVVMEHFDPLEALALIERYQVTHSQWVPTMFIRMLKLSDEERARHDVSSMRMMVHAAAPCPVEVKRRIIEWFGPVVHEYYAGTEGNGFVYCNSEQWLAHPGTVGQNLLGALHITDDEGNELPPGEPGTIWFESPATFEYHNDPEKTAASRNDRGWSTLGDVGRLDEDGFLYLTDRKAYMIITGGVNVYPQEAENILAMHPKVADVAVFGVPNEDFGEEVKAVVQPLSADDAGPELERELIAYCRERLADVKCPRSVDFRPELPRHPTGKLYKRLLKDEYWDAAGRSI